MGNIKKMAGDVLLFFYARKLKIGHSDFDPITFGNSGQGMVFEKNPLADSVIEICNNSPTYAFNALEYLIEKGFIKCRSSSTNVDTTFYAINISAEGIDIIESITRSTAERDNFYFTFNIKLADNINVESLMKNELGSLLKFGLV